MIALLEILLTIVLEIFSSVLLEIVGDLLVGSWRNAFGEEQRTARPELAALGFVLLGSLAGAMSALVRPERLTPDMPIPGLSLIVAPLAAGLVMHFYGRWRRGRSHDTTYFATFWGGSLLAFAMAITRFLMVGDTGL